MEYEVKFIDINAEEMERKILELGGSKVFDRKFRRVLLDYADRRLADDKAWLRVRDEGENVTMAYKKWMGKDAAGQDRGMIEEEVVVSDFDTAIKIFVNTGLEETSYIENRRVQYKLGDVELDIDYYPELEPYIEIEAASWEAIDDTIAKLGLNPDEKKMWSSSDVYKSKGINDKEFRRITFEGMTK